MVEIGFRTNSASTEIEPAAYEWNVQHRSGRFQRIPEEALMLTGDQNMIELNASVHYALDHPDDFVFRQMDGRCDRSGIRRVGDPVDRHPHSD